MATLPEDSVIEILSRLPVKSLLRFKSASKSWCATIQTRSFRYKHLKNKNNNENGGCLWAQYFIDRVYSNSDDEFFLNVFFPDETLANSTHLPFDIPVFQGVLHSPCNGIFLISDKRDVYALWNPATKEYRDLPNPGFPQVGWCWEESCGFGLDPITNNYKVIILQYCEYPDNIMGRVHRLGTEYWKDLGTDLDCFDIMLNRTTCNTYLNGFVHFLGSHSRVISFDMHTDALRVIPPPNELPLPPMGQWVELNERLVGYQDRIALFKIESEEQCLNIWLLKEGSWTKHLSVGPLVGVRYPVGCWNNEGVLLHSASYELLLCKLTTLEIRNLGLYGSYDCLGMNNYKESLISIEDERRHQREREDLVLSHKDSEPQIYPEGQGRAFRWQLDLEDGRVRVTRKID